VRGYVHHPIYRGSREELESRIKELEIELANARWFYKGQIWYWENKKLTYQEMASGYKQDLTTAREALGIIKYQTDEPRWPTIEYEDISFINLTATQALLSISQSQNTKFQRDAETTISSETNNTSEE